MTDIDGFHLLRLLYFYMLALGLINLTLKLKPPQPNSISLPQSIYIHSLQSNTAMNKIHTNESSQHQLHRLCIQYATTATAVSISRLIQANEGA